MSWFRKKTINGKEYWYYIYREDRREKQIYLGDHKKILEKLLPE